MFCKVMEDEEICKGVIERLLKLKVLKIQKHVSQFSIKNTPTAHGIRLDVYVEDSDRVYDVEMQSYRYEEIEKRIRYYQSAIDIDHLPNTTKYMELPESYVVFICLEDPLAMGLPVYTVDQIIEEKPDSKYTDGTHKVLFNASAYKKVKDPVLHDFLKYVYTHESSSPFTDDIENLVVKNRNQQEWRIEYMTWEMKIEDEKNLSRKEGFAQGHAAGFKEGSEQAKAEMQAEVEKLKAEIEKLKAEKN